MGEYGYVLIKKTVADVFEDIYMVQTRKKIADNGVAKPAIGKKTWEQ